MKTRGTTQKIAGEIGSYSVGIVDGVSASVEVVRNYLELLEIEKLQIDISRDDFIWAENKIKRLHIKTMQIEGEVFFKKTIFNGGEYGEVEIDEVLRIGKVSKAVLCRGCKIGKLKIGHINMTRKELERVIEKCEVGEIEVGSFKEQFTLEMMEEIKGWIEKGKLGGDLDWEFRLVGKERMRGEIEKAKKAKRRYIREGSATGYEEDGRFIVVGEEGAGIFLHRVRGIEGREIKIPYETHGLEGIKAERLEVKNIRARDGIAIRGVAIGQGKIGEIEVLENAEDGSVVGNSCFERLEIKRLRVGQERAIERIFKGVKIKELEIGELEVGEYGFEILFMGCEIGKLVIGKTNQRERVTKETIGIRLKGTKVEIEGVTQE